MAKDLLFPPRLFVAMAAFIGLPMALANTDAPPHSGPAVVVTSQRQLARLQQQNAVIAAHNAFLRKLQPMKIGPLPCRHQ